MIDSEFGISDFDDDFAISDNRTFAPNSPHTRQVWSCISKHNDWIQAGKHASMMSGRKMLTVLSVLGTAQVSWILV